MFVELFLISTVIIGYAFSVLRKFRYWEEHEIPNVKPSFPYGNIENFVKGREHIVVVLSKIHNLLKSKYPFCGIYVFFQPIALITDVQLLRTVCNVDFQYFQDRSMYHNEEDDPLSANLVALGGARWRSLRNKLTPAFGSCKIKNMFRLMETVCNQLILCIAEDLDKSPIIEVTEIMAKYTTDVIGTCVFGIECNSLKNPEAKFRQMGRKIFEGNTMTLRLFLLTPFQELAKKLHIRVISAEVAEFFHGIVKESLDFREKNHVERPDLMNILMKLQQSSEHSEEEGDKLTLNEIAAQAFIFFIAGFETTSNTVAFTLYEMARNQDIQDRARQSIQMVLNGKKGILSYNALSEMKYIDHCVNESLRKYPAVPLTTRKATRDYRVPGTKSVLKEGFTVLINIYAIHHDPDYYPEPEVYNPTRFSPEECASRNPYTFLPFGSGPRNCIGSTFAILEIKLALISLLMKYRFHPTTTEPIEFSKTSINLTSATGIRLRVEKLSEAAVK